LNKVLKIALIHDVAEAVYGDVTPYDDISRNDKSNGEKEAIQKIFEDFPNKGKYISLWKEYENGDTDEAKFVKQVDKLEMALQASVYGHQGLNNLEEFYESAKKKLSTEKIKEIFSELIRIKNNESSSQ
jgi:putative hydrolase of HD superfamily